MPFVVDASVTLSWCMPDERTERTERTDVLLGRIVTERAYVPANWAIEVLNGLVVGERRKRLTEAESSAFLRRLSILAITIDADDGWTPLVAILALARRHRLTAYDASYLELAIRLSLPLATDDEDMQTAARSVGIQVL